MREIRQQEATQAFLDTKGHGIIAACPRFGKIKTTINIIKEKNYQSILIVYPRVDIADGWKNDFSKWVKELPVGLNWDFVTYRSLHQIDEGVGIEKLYDCVILDEIHEASRNQLKTINLIDGNKIDIIGLSGTMTKQTRLEIMELTGLVVCYNYSIKQGVEEGILADYQLIVHKVPLDDKEKIYKNGKNTEARQFKAYEWLAGDLSAKDRFIWDLKMIALLQGSIAKRDYTLKLLERYKQERILVFCGTTEIADQLGIDVYHSKKKEHAIFEQFCKDEGINQLAVIKMAQAGVTIVPINKGIINYTSGNPEDFAQKVCRFLGFEYNNPTKKAELHILCSTEKFEKHRISTALSFFEEEKIVYL